MDQKPKSGTYLKRLRNVGENPRVNMLADEYSDDWDTLWWVRADGRAMVLSDQRSMAEPLRLLAERYWQYREAPPTGPVLAVTVERWSGGPRRADRAGGAGASARPGRCRSTALRAIRAPGVSSGADSPGPVRRWFCAARRCAARLVVALRAERVSRSRR